MVAESHQRGEEFEGDRLIDNVDLFPHRVGDPVGARGRGGGGLGESDFNRFLGEVDSRGVTRKVTSAWHGTFGGKAVVQ